MFRQEKNIFSGPALTGDVHKQSAVQIAGTLSGSPNDADGRNFTRGSSSHLLNSAGVHGRILDAGADVRLWRPAKRNVALGVYGRFSAIVSGS